MLKVFVSGTYEDIKDYRLAVIEELARAEVMNVNMERFGAADAEASDISLDRLEDCNVYLGIIGHRYGSVPEGETRSVTRIEYDKAYDLFQKGKMRLLLYLADESIPVPNRLVQEDRLRAAQQEFRGLLKRRHTVKGFKSPEDLASWVRSDLYWLAVVGGHEASERIRIFDSNQDDIEKIREEFDRSARENHDKIHTFLIFMAEIFGSKQSLFHLDVDKLDAHPFFKYVKEKLAQDVIPGVSLDDKEGELIRGGVRHVILRTETFITLVKPLDAKKLHEVGAQIGSSAAHDLIKNTVKGKGFVPASVEAFVMLWGFWDRTGGWGIIEPVNPPHTWEAAPQPEWKIKVSNNFLRDTKDSIEETHRLCNFWCGYIQGLFDASLEQIGDMMGDLNEEQRNKVTFPAYHKVVSVTHLPDAKESIDVFSIIFRKELLSDARRFLSMSRNRLNDKLYEQSMLYSQSALTSARAVLGESFGPQLERLNLPYTHAPLIKEMLSGQFPPGSTEEKAGSWFIAANRLIQELSQEREQSADESSDGQQS